MAAATSCSQEPIVTIDPVVEQYTQNFIKEFGIPAQGHDFAMATSAGLRVKTSNGGHVIVTAEVEGKEYLFADLNVPAGTHALPVTIPRSVSTLKVKSGFKTFEAGINDLVDIDASSPLSRGTWIYDGSNHRLLGDSDDGVDGPLLVFRPSDFLAEYFKEHPVGAKNSTDYYYQGCNVGEGYALPYYEDHQHLFFGETAFGQGTEDYMLFPIWWRKNSDGNKNYTLLLHDIYDPTNMHPVAFGSMPTTDNPFPELKYYTGDLDVLTVDASLHDGHYNNETAYTFRGDDFYYQLINGVDVISDRLFENLDKFVASTGDNAFSMDVPLVASRGIRIKVTDPAYVDHGYAFCLLSGSGENGYDYSFSMPVYNKAMWDDNYFDENLNHLFFSYVSTIQYPLYDVFKQYEVNPFNHEHSPLDHKFDIWQQRAGVGGNPDRFVGASGAPYYDGATLIGFSSAARKAADTDTDRDYTDFIMLAIPDGYLDYVYQGAYPPQPYIWTMAVEDLGGTDDWDFNDVVFHFTDVISNLNTVNKNNLFTSIEGPADAVTTRVITVWPEATGGTMPIYVTFTGTTAAVEMPDWGADKMYSDVNNAILQSLDKGAPGTYVLGTEVHKWLGAEHYTQFVNVGTNRSGKTGRAVQFVIPPTTDLSYAEGNSYGSTENKPLYGFALLVDRENTLAIDAFNDEEKGMRLLPDLKLGEGTYLIGAPDEHGSVAPQMLLISDGDGSWERPTERTKISDAYPNFNDWISNIANSDWTKAPAEGKVTKK